MRIQPWKGSDPLNFVLVNVPKSKKFYCDFFIGFLTPFKIPSVLENAEPDPTLANVEPDPYLEYWEPDPTLENVEPDPTLEHANRIRTWKMRNRIRP